VESPASASTQFPSCHCRLIHGFLTNWLCLCLSGPSMNAGGAPSDAPAHCSLANGGGLLPGATDDGQLRELQGPQHPAPGPHIEAVVYPPPHYTLVRVGPTSRHMRQHAATVPESPSLYSRQAETQSPEFSPLPVPPPRRARRRSQPTPTRTVWCTSLPPLYARYTPACTIPHPSLFLSTSHSLPPSPTRRARTSCRPLVLKILQAPPARCRLLLR
jgi:hypothetical protein